MSGNPVMCTRHQSWWRTDAPVVPLLVISWVSASSPNKTGTWLPCLRIKVQPSPLSVLCQQCYFATWWSSGLFLRLSVARTASKKGSCFSIRPELYLLLPDTEQYYWCIKWSKPLLPFHFITIYCALVISWVLALGFWSLHFSLSIKQPIHSLTFSFCLFIYQMSKHKYVIYVILYTVINHYFGACKFLFKCFSKQTIIFPSAGEVFLADIL